jgi:hypothetical protein
MCEKPGVDAEEIEERLLLDDWKAELLEFVLS